MDVGRVAKLANLSISAVEEKKFARQFKDTLATVDLINELDTSSVLPTHQVTGLTNILRPDEIQSDRVMTQSQAISQARQVDKGYIVVPRTIDG